MEWRDIGLVLGTRPHGERDVVLEAFTRLHGRHLGLVRGGRSRRFAASLQVGNTLDLVWRARLDEQLGAYAVDPAVDRAAMLIAARNGPALAQTLAAHLRLFADRDPHGMLFDAATLILDHAGEPLALLTGLVRFELLILAELGFGLDMSVCALTGATQDIAFVSPKTGRAASYRAGLPYADKLLKIPEFLKGRDGPPDDVLAGFALSGHFLRRDVWDPRRLDPPTSRESLIAGWQRTMAT